MLCTANNILHVISDACAIALHAVAYSPCKHWCISRRSSGYMRAIALLKVAPSYGIQSTNWKSASPRRANDGDRDRRFQSSLYGGQCSRAIYEYFVPSGHRRSVQKLVVAYIVGDARHSSVLACVLGLLRDTRPQVLDYWSRLGLVHCRRLFMPGHVRGCQFCYYCQRGHERYCLSMFCSRVVLDVLILVHFQGSTFLRHKR